MTRERPEAMRRRLGSVFLIGIFLLTYSAQGWGQDKIRIGMGAFSPTNSAIWVAEECGFFKKHGLEVKAIFIGGGATRGVNALLAGDIQFATAGGENPPLGNDAIDRSPDAGMRLPCR
jgi:ABC-type nitrate/sulfonate/bicarbonate transport system substrate-binding protein